MISFIVEYFKNSFSTPSMITGQIIAIVATVLSLFIYVFVKRKLIMATKLAADILWAVSLLFCGAISGAVTNVVSSIREGVCYFKRESWNKRWYIPAVFIVFYIVSAALTWNGFISLFPMVASFASVMGMWATKPVYTKIWCLPALLLWSVYSLVTYNVVSAISNIFSIISVCIGLVRELQFHKKYKTS